MCFHSKQSKKAQTVEKRFDAKIEDIKLFSPSNHYNGFEFPKTPIITNENTKVIQMANWGLLPNWANQDWNKTYTLNARIESLHEKPSYKDIQPQRCIVITNGFFEWQHHNKSKIKYEIGFENELFAFAGLFDIQDNYKSYSIVTTEAKGIMQEIHNTKQRMPIALKTNEQMQNWLQGNTEMGQWNFTVKPLGNYQTKLF